MASRCFRAPPAGARALGAGALCAFLRPYAAHLCVMICVKGIRPFRPELGRHAIRLLDSIAPQVIAPTVSLAISPCDVLQTCTCQCWAMTRSNGIRIDMTGIDWRNSDKDSPPQGLSSKESCLILTVQPLKLLLQICTERSQCRRAIITVCAPPHRLPDCLCGRCPGLGQR